VPQWLWVSAASISVAAAVAAGIVWWFDRGSGDKALPGPVTSQQTNAHMPAATPALPSSEAVAPSAPVFPACGPDQRSALATALAQYPADPATGWHWSGTHPIDSNYDPCADLSTILVTVQGATGSSPIQGLMFHRGTFLGTGTSKAYGFTSLDWDATTKDTVVLSYRTGKSCIACDDGIVTTVRYHWDGTGVQMLDSPPPG
jgi:hypothetical protein